MQFKYDELKKRQRDERGSYPENLALRVHRSLSWLKRAEIEDDLDSKFIFLWIAFNAAYAHEIRDRSLYSEKRVYVQFLSRLIEYDTEKHFYSIVWNELSSSIKSILDNQYIFQPFWECKNGYVTEEEWKEKFELAKRAAMKAISKMDTKKALSIIFDRFYVLRNQLLHGGSTWNSSVNREQIKEGAKLMGMLVPIIIHVMMENHENVWGDPCYPVVE